MANKKNYIFTNKYHPKQGIMSTILGVIALVTLTIAIYISYYNQGLNTLRPAAAAILAMIYALIGIVLGILALGKKDSIKFFSVFGIILNVLAMGTVSMILYAGAYNF